MNTQKLSREGYTKKQIFPRLWGLGTGLLVPEYSFSELGEAGFILRS
jgi:hypothetical protein